ncbi:MAG TPA: YidC/Oxa1 family membrane protein insertase [Candidatus Paceibacterota bacterium]|nr:YidC/Oxa1 family membrane protein insertase [Candidatus Paceibacterota bacterium]
MITDFFREVLYRPLFNILIGITNVIPGHDVGLAIIFLTVLVRLIFLPLSIRSQRSQRALNQLNPKIQEVREKYKNDQVAQGQAIMQLYKDNNVSMVAGCLPILIQFPILLALYRVFIAGLSASSLSLLYPFIHNPGTLNTVFLGFLSIVGKSRVLAVVAAVLQFIQIRQSTRLLAGSVGSNQQMAAINSQMMYVMPAMVLIIGWNSPAGLLLYWVTTTVWAMGEQWYIRRTLS